MSIHLSPLRYPGGKARLAPFLIRVLEANDLRKPHYVEPFAGGAGAALELLCDEYLERITINDADPGIYCFWRSVTEHNEAFLEKLSSVRASIAEWKRQKGIYEARDVERVLDLGFATFYLNRTTRSGIVRNGGPIGGYDQSGTYRIGARFNKEELAARIARIGRYADRIRVSRNDGLTLIRRLDRLKTAPRTFVYLDPPYFHKGPELYLNRFKKRQHETLAQFLAERRNFLWVMTYDDVPEVRKLYKSCGKMTFHLSYSAYERRDGRELFIRPETVALPEKAVRELRAVA